MTVFSLEGRAYGTSVSWPPHRNRLEDASASLDLSAARRHGGCEAEAAAATLSSASSVSLASSHRCLSSVIQKCELNSRIRTIRRAHLLRKEGALVRISFIHFTYPIKWLYFKLLFLLFKKIIGILIILYIIYSIKNNFLYFYVIQYKTKLILDPGHLHPPLSLLIVPDDLPALWNSIMGN